MQDLFLFFTNHLVLALALLVILIFIAILESIRLKKNKQGLSVVEALDQINHHHAQVIDIRTKDLFQADHVINALNVPLQTDFKKTIEKFKTKPIILICSMGHESHKWALQHSENDRIYYLLGGMRAWVDAQMPLTKQ